jgi:hypothetical protein
MAKPLIASMLPTDVFEPEIEVIKYKEVSRALVLNCLDDCWGHVFHKLLNSQNHLENDQEYGLILLIPSNFIWLVPDGVAEVWAVNAKMNEFRKRINNLDGFIKKQFSQFKSVSLSEAHIQPDATKIDIAKFTKIERFNLDKFEESPFTVTFIWREDRFWHGNKWEELLFLASVKFGFLDRLKGYFCWRQMTKYNSVASHVKKKLPETQFNLVGVCKTGKAIVTISDLRKNDFSEQTETEWCKVYAKSHLVVGVHGSNMLLPTALAGGFIEIMPSWKIERWGEDIVQPYPGRKAILLGRFLDGFCSSKLVARHVISIFENYFLFKVTSQSNE